LNTSCARTRYISLHHLAPLPVLRMECLRFPPARGLDRLAITNEEQQSATTICKGITIVPIVAAALASDQPRDLRSRDRPPSRRFENSAGRLVSLRKEAFRQIDLESTDKSASRRKRDDRRYPGCLSSRFFRPDADGASRSRDPFRGDEKSRRYLLSGISFPFNSPRPRLPQRPAAR